MPEPVVPTPSNEPTPTVTPPVEPASTPAVTPAAGADQPGAPAFDVDALSSQIAEKISQGIVAGYQPPPQPAPAPVTPPPKDPVAELLSPYITPGVEKANLTAQAAMDAAVFYSSRPEAVSHKDKLEAAFGTLLERGVPFVREDIWAWYLGKNPDVADGIKKTKADADARKAAEAADLGHGSPPKPGEPKQATEIAPEDLTKAMENVTF